MCRWEHGWRLRHRDLVREKAVQGGTTQQKQRCLERVAEVAPRGAERESCSCGQWLKHSGTAS